MGQFDRFVAALALTGCAAGAGIVLYSAPSGAHAASLHVARTTAASAEQERATRSVVRAANGLSAAIKHEKDETTRSLAKAFASLAASQQGLAAERAQLAGEQLQINAEVQQLAARAAQLTAESAALQRESAALKSAGGTAPTGSGQQHDN